MTKRSGTQENEYGRLRSLREIIVTAMAADDSLGPRFFLKGGNALDIAYGIGNRSSVDLDYSIEDDFDDISDVSMRLARALSERLDAAGYVLFDFRVKPRPTEKTIGTRLGGYSVEFKVIAIEKYASLGGDLEAMRRDSEVSAEESRRVFRIEISKYEYCGSASSVVIRGFDIQVYSPELLAAEKLRAICQQIEGAGSRRNPTPRPRDFYDLVALERSGRVDFLSPEFTELLGKVFAAKNVPIELLDQVPDQRSFHAQAWPGLAASILGEAGTFDDYFIAVVDLIRKIRS